MKLGNLPLVHQLINVWKVQYICSSVKYMISMNGQNLEFAKTPIIDHEHDDLFL